MTDNRRPSILHLALLHGILHRSFWVALWKRGK